MRIVHVITKCDYGGAQTVVRELVLEQVRRGHHVSVITGRLGPVASELGAAGIDVSLEPELVHPIAPRTDRRAVRSLASRLGAIRPDVVHTHSSKGGLVGRLAASRVGLAAVYTAHGWPFQRGASPRQRAVSFAGEWAAARTKAHIVCVTSYERNLARRLRLAPDSRLHVVANGIGRRQEAHPSSTARSGRLELIMVARLSSPKRPDVLIDAVRTLPDVGVTFVGDGVLRPNLEAHAQGLGDRVRFTGYAEPSAFYASAHGAVLLSDYEGLPLAVIEAMRLRLPVITNRLPGVVDAIEHRRNGLLCDLTPHSVAAAIDELRDEGVRSRLGAAAYSDWQRRFTAEAMTDGYDRVYDAVLSESTTR